MISKTFKATHHWNKRGPTGVTFLQVPLFWDKKQLTLALSN